MKISEEKKKAIDELWRFDGCYNEQIKTILNLIEKLQKENEELKEYIMLAPNLDEMTAIKYRNIQEEAYIRGRMEEQQKSEQIIYENYIPIQKVTDSNGKTVWNKTMKNAYLYVFSDGQIQIGRPKFSQLVIYSGKRANKYEKGIIREKEGVYN